MYLFISERTVFTPVRRFRACGVPALIWLCLLHHQPPSIFSSTNARREKDNLRFLGESWGEHETLELFHLQRSPLGHWCAGCTRGVPRRNHVQEDGRLLQCSLVSIPKLWSGLHLSRGALVKKLCVKSRSTHLEGDGR